MKKNSLNAANGNGATRPAHDQIASLAYSLYLDRGGQPGHDQDDWYCAEQLLAGQINLEAAARAVAADNQTRSQRSRGAARAL